MASPSELSLDMKPHSYSMLLKSFTTGEHQLLEPKQLEDFLACLEDERLKIEAFKRELPLCMQLLSNAVEASRQKLHAVKSSNHGSGLVLEEFIPLRSPTADGETDMETATKTDKSNWMVSAQLWSQTPNVESNNNLTKQYEDQTDMGLDINSSSTLACLQRNPNPAGAFIPFSKERRSTAPSPTLPTSNSLAIPNNINEHQLLEEKKLLGAELISGYCPSNMISGGVGGMTENDQPMRAAAEHTLTTSNNTTHTNSTNNTNNNNSSSNQPHRKARRCWSPDLHRKFVNALQMLGGSQVATPKQIRELMKVDGLTNDEVKSHLQKYRLHTRRPSPSPPQQLPTGAGAPAAAQLVVLGGIWVPPEYAAHHNSALYGPHHHQTVPVGPEFYAAGQHQHHHRQQQQQMFHIHQQHQQMQMQQLQMQRAIDVYNNKNKGSSQDDQSEAARGVSESIEDGKSESGSWKGGEISVVENGKER